jgi:acetyl esterase/lipase
MKKWRANKSFIALLIGMIMLFGGVLMGRSIASDFGKIKIRDISITNDDLVNIKGRIFIPSNASADNPLPAVIFCPGGSTPGTYYTAAETEIARHGFVVISWDYESVGMTEAGTDKNQGAVAVAQYVRSLGFVDPSRLGLIGHSAGELLASHILDTLKDDPSIQLSYFALENKIPKVTVNGDSVPFTQGNVGLSWGKYDENAIQRDWNTRDNDNLQLPDDFYTVFGLDKGTKVETNKWYGDYTNGTGRILLTPAISHCFGSAYPDSLKLANRFFTATYYGKETQDNSLLCYWTLLFLAFAWIGVFVIVLAFIEMLLSVPRFFRICQSESVT